MAQHITVLPLTRVIGYAASKDNSMICVASEIEQQSNSNIKDIFFMGVSTQNDEIIWKFKDKNPNTPVLGQTMDFSPDNKYFVYSRENDFVIMDIKERKKIDVTILDYEEVEIFVNSDDKEVYEPERNDTGNWVDSEGNITEELTTCYKLRREAKPITLLKFIDNENLLIITWGSIKIFNTKTNVSTQVPHEFDLETAYIKSDGTLFLIATQNDDIDTQLQFCILSVDQLIRYQKKFEKHINSHYQNELNFGNNFTKFDEELEWNRFPELKRVRSFELCDDYFILNIYHHDRTLDYIDFRNYYLNGSYKYFEENLKIPITLNNQPVTNILVKLKNTIDPHYNATILGTFYADFMFICQWGHKIWCISNRTELFYVDISQTVFYKLAELITYGLIDENLQRGQHWETFLRKGIYDPRLFCLIYEFVREPENTDFPAGPIGIPASNLFQHAAIPDIDDADDDDEEN